MNKQLPEIVANPDRIEVDEAYMRMAEIWAKRSKSNRSQVGAILVKDRQIISDGYNGLPSGVEPDVCEYYDDHGNLVTKANVIHAESNAILKLARQGTASSNDATMYITLAPCHQCAKLIHQAGIKHVFYREAYRDTAGIDHLKTYGVQVTHLKKD